MISGQPFFSFLCDIDGRFAVVKLWRGSISWQIARVSSTVRLLSTGLPIAIIVGVACGASFWNVFGPGVLAIVSHVFGAVVGVLLGWVLGYRLGMWLGDVIFPTRNSPIEALPVAVGMSVDSRRAGRLFSFVTVRSSAGEVELRVSTRMVATLLPKLRAIEPRT